EPQTGHVLFPITPANLATLVVFDSGWRIRGTVDLLFRPSPRRAARGTRAGAGANRYRSARRYRLEPLADSDHERSGSRAKRPGGWGAPRTTFPHAHQPPPVPRRHETHPPAVQS